MHKKQGNCTLWVIQYLIFFCFFLPLPIKIGSQYLDTGISWLSEMLNSNKKIWNDKLEINTIYYLEKITRKYIYKNREKIRRTKKLKQEVLIILDFLVEKGSVIGYILRENIL